MDWIKVEKATIDKPEMARIARHLGISRNDAFVEFIRLYSWADTNVADDGFVPFLSPSDGDSLAHVCPGFCEAMAKPDVGWLKVENNGIRFVNWDRHNGKSAKRRQLDTEKKRKQRAEKPDMSPKCPDDNGTKTGPEKRREEKNIYKSAHEKELSELNQEIGDCQTFGVPSPQFEHLFAQLPKRMQSAKQKAYLAYLEAIQGLILQGKSRHDAEFHVFSRVEKFSDSPKAKGSDYLWAAATFFSDGHYDDSDEAWGYGAKPPPSRRNSDEPPTVPPLQPRKPAANRT